MAAMPRSPAPPTGTGGVAAPTGRLTSQASGSAQGAQHAQARECDTGPAVGHVANYLRSRGWLITWMTLSPIFAASFPSLKKPLSFPTLALNRPIRLDPTKEAPGTKPGKKLLIGATVAPCSAPAPPRRPGCCRARIAPRLGLAVGWQESSLMSGSSNKERP